MIGKFAAAFGLLLLLVAPALSQQAPIPAAQGRAAAPLTVLSIIPAQGQPGTTVTLNGTGFTQGTTVFLGSRQLPANVAGGRVITAELPNLPPGVYALYLQREDGATSRPFNFLLQALKPVAFSLSPDTVTICSSGPEREVVLYGANFENGSRVFLDGAGIATRVLSPTTLSFNVPQLTAGLHQVQVRNPSEAESSTLALTIDSQPEIRGVYVGAESVSYYDLVVTGKNFQQTSALMVDGKRVDTVKQVAGEREQLFYLGCNQLVYQRHPYDPTPKEIRLQVVNRNGEQSNIFIITAP